MELAHQGEGAAVVPCGAQGVKGPTIGEVIRWVVTWPASAAVDVSAVRNGCSDSTDRRKAHELEVT